MIGGQVCPAQLLRQRQVLVGLGEQSTVALHRAEPGEHLDPTGVPVAVHLTVQLPGVGQPVPGQVTLTLGVFHGGQVGVCREHPQRLGPVGGGQLDDDVPVEPGGADMTAHPVQDGDEGGRGGDGPGIRRPVQSGGG